MEILIIEVYNERRGERKKRETELERGGKRERERKVGRERKSQIKKE